MPKMISEFIERIPENHLQNWSWWLTLATFVIPAIAGVIALLTGYGALRINDRITAVTERTTGDLKRDLGDAKQSAADAHKIASELAEKQRFRTITPEHRKQFVDLLAVARKGRVRISVMAGNKEAFDFATQVRDMVREAGYSTPDTMNSLQLFGPPLLGMVIKVKSEPEQAPFAGDMQRAFSAIGIEALGDKDSSLDADIVLLQIGAKP
jgi:hypothetical protein